MTRVVAIALVLSLSGCNFATKHPAVTAGIVAGSLGLGSCELASDNQKACFEIAGAAGLGLALITAAALWLGYDDSPEPQVIDPTLLDGQLPIRVPTSDQAPPPPRPPEPPAPAPAPAPAPTPAPDPAPSTGTPPPP